MKHDATFRERIRSAMTESKMTVRELSERTGIPARTIEDWRSGIGAPAKYTQDIVLAAIKRDPK